MKNGQIEASRLKAIAWGRFLTRTFRELHVTDNRVIKHCHIGRTAYYRMKQGRLINVDAYLRLTDFAIQKIQERADTGFWPPDAQIKWKKHFWRIVTDNP